MVRQVSVPDNDNVIIVSKPTQNLYKQGMEVKHRFFWSPFPLLLYTGFNTRKNLGGSRSSTSSWDCLRI